MPYDATPHHYLGRRCFQFCQNRPGLDAEEGCFLVPKLITTGQEFRQVLSAGSARICAILGSSLTFQQVISAQWWIEWLLPISNGTESPASLVFASNESALMLPPWITALCCFVVLLQLGTFLMKEEWGVGAEPQLLKGSWPCQKWQEGQKKAQTRPVLLWTWVGNYFQLFIFILSCQKG